MGCHSLLQGDLPKPGTEPRSPTLQEDSLPTEPPRKPKNTGVGCRSLLQGILPTQESNSSLLHCRWILYQLSYQGSPWNLWYSLKTSPVFWGWGGRVAAKGSWGWWNLEVQVLLMKTFNQSSYFSAPFYTLTFKSAHCL